MKVAMFGGSFDPIHRGHLQIVDEVLNRLAYDRVLIVPAALAPHKSGPPAASGTDRVAMIRLAIAGRADLEIDTFELDAGDVSYTVRTLRHMYDRTDLEGKPGLIIGADLAAGFDSWRAVDEIEALADIVVLQRPGAGAALPGRRHVVVENPPVDISSSDIRRRVSRGESFRHLVTPDVYEYIRSHDLYRSASSR